MYKAMEECRVNQIIPNEESGTVLATVNDKTLWNSLRNEEISMVRAWEQIPQFCSVYSLFFFVQAIFASK